MRLRTTHHGLNHRLTHRPNSGKQRLGNLQLFSLLCIGVSDIPGLEPGRAAGNSGNRLGNPATGAGLGCRHLGLGDHQLCAQFGSQLGQSIFISSHLHSGVKASQADTVH